MRSPAIILGYSLIIQVDILFFAAYTADYDPCSNVQLLLVGVDDYQLLTVCLRLSDIANSWRRIHLELPLAFAQKVLDRGEVFFADKDILLEFRPTAIVSSGFKRLRQFSRLLNRQEFGDAPSICFEVIL